MAPQNGLGWLWNNKSFSDVTLTLSWSTKDDTSVSGPSVQRSDSKTYYLHANMLSSYSEYFETRTKSLVEKAPEGTLQYSDYNRASQSSDADAPRPHVVLLEHIDNADDVEAFENMLLFFYTGDLGARSTSSKLVSIMALADRYLIPKAVEQAIQQLHASLAQGLPLDVACRILTCTPPSLQDHPQLLSVTDAALRKLLGNLPANATSPATTAPTASNLAATAAASTTSNTAATCLFQLFSNVEAVCQVDISNVKPNAPFNIARLFRRLTLDALLMLLASDKLVACSEDSVLVLANMWVSANKHSVDSAQLRRIAEHIHCGQLSLAFLCDMVPKLSWMAASPPKRMALQRFAASPKRLQVCDFFVKTLVGPRSWFVTAQRTAPEGPEGGINMTWEVSRSEVETSLAIGQSASGIVALRSSNPFFHRGFQYTMHLCLLRQHGLYLGHQVEVAGPAGKGLAHSGVLTRVAFTVLCNGKRMTQPWEDVLNDEQYSACLRLLSLKDKWSDIATWEPYLTDGVLRVNCVATVCQ